MNMLLNTNLDPVNMGNNQRELSDWVEKDRRWLDFVEKVNTSKILQKDPDSPHPTAESLDLIHEKFNFHPDDLITEACNDLVWVTVPQTGGFEMNFYVEQPSEKIEWQVGYDSDDKPAFGIDMFDSESEAKEHAEALWYRGKQGITLTKFIDTAPMQTWQLKADEWI